MTATRTATRSLLVALVIAVLGGLGLAGAAPASASVTGSQFTIMCGGGQVKAMAGAVYTNQNEAVYWVPILFMHDGTKWVQLNTGALKVAWAGSVNGRTGLWSDYYTNAGVNWRQFDNLPTNRYYAVVSYFYTASGGWSTAVASYGNTYFCLA